MLTYEYIKQPKGGYCLPTSITIALNAFGDKRFKILELAKMMNTKKVGGTSASTCVETLISLGYDIKWNCALRHFDVISTIHTFDQEQLQRYLKKRFSWATKTIEKGAVFKPIGATLWNIDDDIKSGASVIVQIDAPMLWHSKVRKISSHAVIVQRVDFEKRIVEIIDPAKGPSKISFDVFEAIRVVDRTSISIFRKAVCGL